MGCVQSYFKKGSYDVYEAHNAGMSPSSTQSSEKAPPGEPEIEAQENKDDVQTAVRVFAVDETTLRNKRDAADQAEVGNSASDAVVTGVGATGAVVVTTAEYGDSSRAGEKQAEVTDTEKMPAGSLRECDVSNNKEVSENVGDNSDIINKTEIEDDKPVDLSIPVTLVKQEDESATEPMNGVKPCDNNDSAVRKNDLASDIIMPEREETSSVKKCDINEAIILEEQAKQDILIVTNTSIDGESVQSTEENTKTSSNEPDTYANQSNQVTISRTEDVDHGLLSRKSEAHVIGDDQSSSVAPKEEMLPIMCESALIEDANKHGVVNMVEEPGKEAVPNSLIGEVGKVIEELGEKTNVARSDETTLKQDEKYANYSSSVDSAEEALSSSLNEIGEKYNKTKNEAVEAETLSGDMELKCSENILPSVAAEEAVLNRDICVSSENHLKETSQAKQINDSEKKYSTRSSPLELSGEGIPITPISMAGKTSDISEKLCKDYVDEIPSTKSIEEAILKEQGRNSFIPETKENTDISQSDIFSKDNSEELANKCLSTEKLNNEKNTATPLNLSVESNKNLVEPQIIGEIAEQELSRTPITPPTEPIDNCNINSSPNNVLDKTNDIVEPPHNDPSAAKKKESEILTSEHNEIVKENSEKPLLNLHSKNSVTENNLLSKEAIKEHNNNKFPSSETIRKEISRSPLKMSSESVESNRELQNYAEENASKSPYNKICDWTLENTDEVSSATQIQNVFLSQPLSDVREDVDHSENLYNFENEKETITNKFPSLPLEIGLPSDVTPTENITKLSSSSSSELVTEIPSYEEALNEASTKEFFSDASEPVEINIENTSSLKTAEIDDTSRSLSELNELIEDNVSIPLSTKCEDFTVLKRDSSHNNEYYEEDDQLSFTAEQAGGHTSSRPLSVNSETDKNKSKTFTSVYSAEHACPSRLISDASVTIDEPVEETVLSKSLDFTDGHSGKSLEYKSSISTQLLAEHEKGVVTEIKTNNEICKDGSIQIQTKTTVTSTEDANKLQSDDTKSISSKEMEIITKIVSQSKAIAGEDSANHTGKDQQSSKVEELFDSSLQTTEKEEMVPFANEMCNNKVLEAMEAVENYTEEVDKEDSKIESNPESIMTVPVSMGDIELSSESSFGGLIEKSSEETKSEDIKNFEHEDSSLIGKLIDESVKDTLVQKNNTENTDDGNYDNQEYKDRLSKPIINGVEHENKDDNLYADAFGRPVPTINLIESEEQKRSDSEEDNDVIVSPEIKEEVCDVAKSKEDEILGTKELSMNDTLLETTPTGPTPVDEGEDSPSESATGSDSVNLRHRDDGRSDSGTSQSRADSMVAEKGSELESLATVSAAPSTDGTRLVSEEDHEASFKEPAAPQSSNTRDCAKEVQEAALNIAATTIQASFRGFQTRQALHTSPETTQVPTAGSQQDVADQKFSEHMITPDIGFIPKDDSTIETPNRASSRESADPPREDQQTSGLTDSEDKQPARPSDTEDRQPSGRKDSEDKTPARLSVTEDRQTPGLTDSEEKTPAEPTDIEDQQLTGRTDSEGQQPADPMDSEDRQSARTSDSKDKQPARPSDTKDRQLSGRTDSEDKQSAKLSDTENRQLSERTDIEDKTPARLSDTEDRQLSGRTDSEDKTPARPSDTKDRQLSGRTDSEDKQSAKLSNTKNRQLSERTDFEDKQAAKLSDTEDRQPAEPTDSDDEDLASLQRPPECDELPEHRGEASQDGSEAPTSEDVDSSPSSAATKIQSCFRGYMVRKNKHDTVEDSIAMSLTNEPSIPDSQQSFGTFSTSNEDNGVHTSGSLETAVQRQKDSTLDEVEELVGSGPPLQMDTSIHQVSNTSNLNERVSTEMLVSSENNLNKAKETTKGLSLDSTVDATAKHEQVAQKALSLQETSTGVDEEDRNVRMTIEKELSEAATKIQSNYRGYRARQRLTREDAFQVPTTSTSSAASADSDKMAECEIRASGEFHDMMVLPPGEISNLTNGENTSA